MNRLAVSCIAFTVALNGACAADQTVSATKMVVSKTAAWPDECSSLPGFTSFQEELQKASNSRDPAKLIAMLHPRLLPKSREPLFSTNAYGWLYGRYRAEAFWSEMHEALKLGCARHGDKVLVPAMAKLIHDHSLDTAFDVAVVPTQVRSRPDPTAPVIRHLKTGDLVRTVSYDSPAGWISVDFGNREGFVRTADLRSPHDFQLELGREGDRWHIYDLGSGV